MTSVTARTTEMCLGSNGDQARRTVSVTFLCPCDTHYEHVVYESMVGQVEELLLQDMDIPLWSRPSVGTRVYTRGISRLLHEQLQKTRIPNLDGHGPWTWRGLGGCEDGAGAQSRDIQFYELHWCTPSLSLSLTGWRLEPKCANLLHLYEEQKEQVVDTLQTLIDKLKAWGIAERTKWIQKDWWVCDSGGLGTLVLRVLRHHHRPVNNLSSLFSFKRT